MDIVALLQAMNGTRERKIERTLPIKPEWRAQFDRYEAAHDEVVKLETQLKKAVTKAEAIRNLAWISVHEDTGLDNDMRYNNEDNRIEVFEDEECPVHGDKH